MTFQKSLFSPLEWTLFQQKNALFVTDVIMTLLVPTESVNTRVVITLVLT